MIGLVVCVGFCFMLAIGVLAVLALLVTRVPDKNETKEVS